MKTIDTNSVNENFKNEVRSSESGTPLAEELSAVGADVALVDLTECRFFSSSFVHHCSLLSIFGVDCHAAN